MKEHNNRLDKVLEALSRANFTLNAEKCVFAAAEVEHLGHLVDASPRPNPSKVAAVSLMANHAA